MSKRRVEPRIVIIHLNKVSLSKFIIVLMNKSNSEILTYEVEKFG